MNFQQLKPDFLLIPYGWAAPENKWPEHGKELQKVVQKAAKLIRIGACMRRFRATMALLESFLAE